jgi:hypothetical protein
MFQRRFEAQGNSVDHEVAIFHARCALDIGPPDRRAVLFASSLATNDYRD